MMTQGRGRGARQAGAKKGTEGGAEREERPHAWHVMRPGELWPLLGCMRCARVQKSRVAAWASKHHHQILQQSGRYSSPPTQRARPVPPSCCCLAAIAAAAAARTRCSRSSDATAAPTQATGGLPCLPACLLRLTAPLFRAAFDNVCVCVCGWLLAGRLLRLWQNKCANDRARCDHWILTTAEEEPARCVRRDMMGFQWYKCNQWWRQGARGRTPTLARHVASAACPSHLTSPNAPFFFSPDPCFAPLPSLVLVFSPYLVIPSYYRHHKGTTKHCAS